MVLHLEVLMMHVVMVACQTSKMAACAKVRNCMKRFITKLCSGDRK